MNSGLFLTPLVLLALACSGDPTPTQSIGGENPPTVNAAGDTNVSALGFVTKAVVVNGASYGYQVFVPATYNSAKTVPVVVFMHGAGQSGSDNDQQTRIGLGSIVRAQASTFPAVVVFPQSPSGEGSAPWKTYNKIVSAALDKTMKEYGRADPARIYLTGWSYGGVHGFDVAYAAPTRFAALVPIAATIYGEGLTGSTSTTPEQGAVLIADKLKTLPIWQFHGALDKTIPPSYIAPQVAVLKSSGANYQYTEFPNGDHQLTDNVYVQASFWTWLWAQHR